MKLNLDFNGAQLNAANLKTIANAAASGVNTTISVNTAQAANVSDLVTIVRLAK